MGRRVLVERGVPMTARDGVELVADVYRLDDDQPRPVLVQRTPYDRTMTWNYASVVDPIKMALGGYVMVIQDVRGRFDSGGDFEAYTNEGEDGYDTIEWAAKQPWSDGNVGIFGLSYMAQCALLAAAARPPSLRAVAALESPDNATGGDRYRGGALALGVLSSWTVSAIVPAAVLRAGREDPNRYAEIAAVVDDVDNLDDYTRRLPLVPFPPVDSRAGVDPNHVFDRTVRYEFFPAVPRFKASDIEVPVLLLAGWNDLFLQPNIDLYHGLRRDGGTAAVRELSRLVVGPWGHGSPTAVVGQTDFGFRASPLFLDLKQDFSKLHLRWFDARIHGAATGIDAEPPVTFFTMGTNRWRGEGEWPPPQAREQEWFLHADGALSRREPRPSDASEFCLRPDDPVPTLGGALLMNGKYLRGPVDQARIEARDDVLLFTSDALDSPLEVSGRVRLSAFVAAETVDTDVVARLCDVHPDGRSFNVCDGILRLRFREGVDRPGLLEPGELYQVEVDLWSTSHTFLAGHRLRLQVRASDFPRYDRNPGTGQTSAEVDHVEPQRNRIFHDPEHPSYLVLPVVP